jgi:AraC-like DNA-binding protein
MNSIASRVEQFVRECQRFAGESSFVACPNEQLRLVRNFVTRLPDARDHAEALIFRGVLVDVAFKWARHIQEDVHRLPSGQSRTVPLVEALTSSRGERIACYKDVFERWATAFLENLERAHLVSPAMRAKVIIDRRFAEHFQLRELARMVGCTSVRLRMLFKEEFGISLREYRTRARVLNAAKLVADSDVKIEAIAVLAGFRSKRNFYKAFRQVMGGTPSEFRRREVHQSVVDLRSKEWRAAPGFPAERSL